MITEIVTDSAGESAKQIAPFATFEEQARKLVADAEAIALLEPSPANAKVARTMRLTVRPLRTSVEKRYDELKRPLIDEGNRLTAAKDALVDILKPLEEKLLAIEKHAERKEEERIILLLSSYSLSLSASLIGEKERDR